MNETPPTHRHVWTPDANENLRCECGDEVDPGDVMDVFTIEAPRPTPLFCLTSGCSADPSFAGFILVAVSTGVVEISTPLFYACPDHLPSAIRSANAALKAGQYLVVRPGATMDIRQAHLCRHGSLFCPDCDEASDR